MARPGLCQHRQKPRGPGTALEPGAQSGCGTGDLLWALPSPVPPAIPPLVTMGTLGCDPAPRLTTAPLGRRATECQIPETGLRKTCGTATSGTATSGDGRCGCGGGAWWGDPFRSLRGARGLRFPPRRAGVSVAPAGCRGQRPGRRRQEAGGRVSRRTGQRAERSGSDANCGISVRAPAGASVSPSVTKRPESGSVAGLPGPGHRSHSCVSVSGPQSTCGPQGRRRLLALGPSP